MPFAGPLCLIAVRGVVPKEIGNAMSPSVKIVATCHARILEELKVENNVQINGVSLWNGRRS
jgi:hypothetical protein